MEHEHEHGYQLSSVYNNFLYYIFYVLRFLSSRHVKAGARVDSLEQLATEDMLVLVIGQLEEVGTAASSREAFLVFTRIADREPGVEVREAEERGAGARRDEADKSAALSLRETQYDAPEHLYSRAVVEAGHSRVLAQITDINRRLLATKQLRELLLVEHAEPLWVDNVGKTREEGSRLLPELPVKLVPTHKLDVLVPIV
jgi:hypothetical protein